MTLGTTLGGQQHSTLSESLTRIRRAQAETIPAPQLNGVYVLVVEPEEVPLNLTAIYALTV